MTPEEILIKIWDSNKNDLDLDIILSPDLMKIQQAMKEYAIQERNKALVWAAENGTVDHDGYDWIVDKSSILAGKEHKDLEIK